MISKRQDEVEKRMDKLEDKREEKLCELGEEIIKLKESEAVSVLGDTDVKEILEKELREA